MSTARKKACGLLFCYNEESVIGENIKYYLGQGIDLVVFDNRSTDASMGIIMSFNKEGLPYAGKILEVVSIQTQGYDWKHILRDANDYMHRRLSHYEWIMIIDADTLFFSAVKGVELLDYLDEVKGAGYNIIHARIYNFYPTEKDNPAASDFKERIQYFKVWNLYPQEKVFLYHPSINFYDRYAHWCLRDDRRVCINPGIIAKHYIWISFKQGMQKVFRDRKPRYTKDFPIQPQYAYMLPLEKCFIRDSRELKYYDPSRELVSRRRFLFITRIICVHNFIFSMLWRRRVRLETAEGTASLRNSAVHAEPKPAQGLIKVKNSLRKTAAAILPAGCKKFVKSLFPYHISAAGDDYKFSNIIDRLFAPGLDSEPLSVSLSYPCEYHFIMTSYCNARCIFCNQIDDKEKSEITLDKFKTMLSHIPLGAADQFIFSGGGDPLLCHDLFDIIRHVKTSLTQVKMTLVTNGRLIEKYAAQIAGSGLDRLIISVHGTEQMNDYIQQVSGSETIFKGLELLNKYAPSGKKIRKIFSVTVSSLNINELPLLVKRAGQLGIDEVSVLFCRYFSHRLADKLKEQDSLFFHKGLYNSKVKESSRIARRIGVKFVHEPLFFKKFKQTNCCQPWYLALVDCDGDVYPCTGGEAVFYRKVKSGAFRLGNLLEEDLGAFWMNEAYTKLRRQILGLDKQEYVAECANCHNILCFKGPDTKAGHIIS